MFYGTGKALDEASAAELAQDMKERTSENPLAYQGNKLVNALSDKEVQRIKKKKK